MKLPEYMTRESSHSTPGVNTMSLTGLSLLWAVMLNLISPWWLTLSILTILAGYGSEISRRKDG
jgi:hypothetical protein